MKTLISSLLFCISFCVFAQNPHQTREILEILKTSALNYRFEEVKATGQEIPKGAENSQFVFPYFPKGSQQPVLKNYELSPYEEEAFRAAEILFAKEKYAEAREKYELTLLAKPDFAPAMTFIGQTYGLENNLVMAIRWYEKAIAVNFHDFKAHWFLAKTLFAMERYEEALPEISLALVLNRNHTEIAADLRYFFKDSRLNFQEWTFRPAFGINLTEDEIIIKHGPGWKQYAGVKALWNLEPGYREQMSGSAEPDPFSLPEEREALLNLLWENTDSKGRINSKIPAIPYLQNATERKMLIDFIFFELWLPQEPLIAYTQSPEALKRIARYVMEVRGR